jgi:YesN/AraC family two-component response regulator
MESHNVIRNERKTILIIDDERGVLDSLEELFSDSYDVLKAEDGKEGLSLFRSLRIDLVLLDLKMPGMDGVEVLENIREISKTIPIFIMTAYSTIQRAERCADLMGQGYIRKPFDPLDLLDRVEATLKENIWVGDFHENHSKSRPLDRPSIPVRESIKFIGSHYTEHILPRDVAAEVHISREYMGKLFKQEMGCSVHEKINRLKIEKAKRLLLKKRNLNLSEIAREAGFTDDSYFCRRFKKQTSMTPTDFKKTFS